MKGSSVENKNLFFSFIIGGSLTALIVGLEQYKMQTWSALAALMPLSTLVSYYFIGTHESSISISQHSKFVLFGTLFSWVPYMTIIALSAPKLGTNKSIFLGMIVFFILATFYVFFVEKLNLFK